MNHEDVCNDRFKKSISVYLFAYYLLFCHIITFYSSVINVRNVNGVDIVVIYI